MGLIEDTPVPISQYEKEFNFLLNLYEVKQPKRVLEIGTHQGGTLYHWIKNAPMGANILAIDNQHINKDLYPEWSGYPSWEVFTDYYLGDSKSNEAFEYAKRFAPYDWVFIDGDHSYDGVLWDWNTAMFLADFDSVVAFHDITPHPHRQVDKLWQEIKRGFSAWEEVVDMSYPEGERCGIGIIYLD